MARRKKKQVEGNGHGRWLVSYADFITLLFAFFTSMYAISTVDAKKAGKMVFSTRAAFNLDFFPSESAVLGYPPVAQERTPVETSSATAKAAVLGQQETPRPNIPVWDSRAMARLADELRTYVDRLDRTRDVEVRRERRGVVVSISATALFAPGRAEIHRSSLPALDRIAERLLATGLPLRVEGHTAGLGGRNRSNWRLSTARAVSVVAYLVDEYGFPADRLSASGYASYKPVASNETAAGRAANRRVDLVVEYAPDRVGVD